MIESLVLEKQGCRRDGVEGSSVLPEATLLLCVYCYDFYSPASHPEEPQTGVQGAADRSGADQREVVN